MSPLRILTCAALASCLAWASPLAVAANGRALPRPDEVAGEHIPALFWRSVGTPGIRRAWALTDQAKQLMRIATRQLPAAWEVICKRTHALPGAAHLPAVREGRARAMRQWLRQAMRRRAYLDNAIARLEQAARLAPDDPAILHTLATVHLQWEQPASIWHCGTYRHDDQALERFQRLRALAPDYEPERVATQLGGLYTRREQFAQAADEFLRALQLTFDRQQSALTRYNLAEVTMLAGDLDGALHHYRRAVSTAQEPRTYVLALWGLAVAQDRAQDHEAALDAALKAIQSGGGNMQVLHSDGVYFSPEEEIHYYEALGHEALAQLEPEEASEHLRAARHAWQRFLTTAPASSRWVPQAKSNLDRLDSP